LEQNKGNIKLGTGNFLDHRLSKREISGEQKLANSGGGKGTETKSKKER